MTPLGELEYGSILPNGEDWRLRRCDAGLFHLCTEYRIFRNEIFFAQFSNRKDADIVMVAMTCAILPKREFAKNCMCDKYTNCTDCQKHDDEIRQSSRDTVLDDFAQWVKTEWVKESIKDYKAELHQKAGSP